MIATLLRTDRTRRLFLPVTLALGLAALAGAAGAAEPAPAKPPIVTAAESALWWGDFGTLERQNAEYRQPGRFNPDGTSQLDQFRSGLARVFNARIKNPEPYMQELDAMTLQWAQANPLSPFAHVLHARALLAHGESYRGTGFAKDVSEDALTIYRRYLNEAAAYLKDHAEVALADSYAHYVLIRIGTGLGWTPAQLEVIAQQGLQRNPEDGALPLAMVDRLLPKWGGDSKSLDAYIRKAAANAHERSGAGLYAILYSKAEDEQYGKTLFEASRADWDTMKGSYEDILARYPDSSPYRNRYAYMACIARDRPVLQRLLEQLGTQLRTDAWGSNPERTIETCRSWATQE